TYMEWPEDESFGSESWLYRHAFLP
ncbi:hypothetical protein D046_8546, partial [Vibrio parahaemolyticus V-223/04]